MSKYTDNKDSFLEPQVNQYGRNMVMTNVHKPSKCKYINVDTKFSDDYNYTGNATFSMTLPERITNVQSIAVRTLELPITYYNISANFGNNFFKITNSVNASKMVIIPNGQYTVSLLQSQINTQIQTLGSDFIDVSFNISGSNPIASSATYSGYKSTLTALAGITGLSVHFDTDSSGNFDKYNFKSKLGWLLGFRNQAYTLSASITVSEQFINLSGPKYLYLIVDEFSQKSPNSFISPQAGFLMSKNILARITVNTQVYPFGSTLPANNFDGYLLTDSRNYQGTIDIKKINIQLVNDTGIPVNLNGQDFSFCLEVIYE